MKKVVYAANNIMKLVNENFSSLLILFSRSQGMINIYLAVKYRTNEKLSSSTPNRDKGELKHRRF